jgi:hypothetical protein
MTTDELIKYYSDLLIIQYKSRARAVETVRAFVDPVIMDQLPFAVRDAHDIDTAAGEQLDLIGKLVGVKREVKTFTGVKQLNDTDFRLLIRMQIVQSNSSSTLADIQRLLNRFIPGVMKLYDYQNMSISYYFNSAYGSEDLAEAFVKLGVLPKPMGVQVASLIYGYNLDNIFSLRTYTLGYPDTSGFNSYSSYGSGRPWISYSNSVAL